MKKISILLAIVGLILMNTTIFAQTTINSENFNDTTLGTWTNVNVVGTKSWYGSYYNADVFAKISGYGSANETWLISPQIDFTLYNPVKFSFESACASYAGADLEVYVSTNYSGSGSPTTSTWTKLTASLSTGSYAWVNSGEIDLSAYTGKGYLAFKYTSTSTAAKLYEIDNISITGGSAVYSGEDTITVMQYNLLAYTSNTYIYCNQTNNNITNKDGYIKTITQYVKPDIFTVNEISNNSSDHDRLKNNCLNVNGVTSYLRTNLYNSGGSSVINQMYYKSDLFSVALQTSISTAERDVNIVKLKYKKNDDEGNPIYLTCLIAHLKAGSTSSDSIQRISETATIMNYLAGLSDMGNVLLMGDFNIGSSYEECYQNLVDPTNTAIKLVDPINKPGNWYYSSFASIHTQSTHTEDNDCASTGGLDDRYDFILASNSVMQGTKKITYLSNSYKAVGQDGLHYNVALNASPVNSTVPADVANALYNNSDHLPVMLKLKLKTTYVNGIDEILVSKNGLYLNFTNPTNNSLDLFIENTKSYSGSVKIEVYSIVGQQIISENLTLNAGVNEHSLSLKNTKPGIYIVKMIDENQNYQTKKLIVK